jgi:SAM-dependent methyltransferase
MTAPPGPLPKVPDLLWENLRELPAFRSLIRAIEGRLVRELGALAGPFLDLGCGDGHFSQVALGSADAGIDLELASLARARRRDVYRLLASSSAARIPFRDASFATALANCALEHMPELDRVFAEVTRVLRPGGRFVFSVPNDRHNENLLVARVLDGCGLSGLASRYRSWFKRMQVHHHMYSEEEWRRRCEAFGLRVISCRPYLSPRATILLELGHYYGADNVLNKALFGKWVVLPYRPRFALVEKFLSRYVAEDGVPESSCFFFVAVKA